MAVVVRVLAAAAAALVVVAVIVCMRVVVIVVVIVVDDRGRRSSCRRGVLVLLGIDQRRVQLQLDGHRGCRAALRVLEHSAMISAPRRTSSTAPR